MIGAHIAGLPVEETLLSLAPVGGVLALAVRDGLRRAVRRGPARHARAGPRQVEGRTDHPG